MEQDWKLITKEQAAEVFKTSVGTFNTWGIPVAKKIDNKNYYNLHAIIENRSQAARPENPHWFNRKEMLSVIGIVSSTFDGWGIQPKERRGKETFYDIRDVISFLIRRNENRADNTEAINLEREEARLKKLQADRIEFDLKEKYGDIMPFKLVRQILEDMVKSFSKTLSSIPKKMAPRLLKIENPGKIEELLHREIAITVKELRSFQAKRYTLIDDEIIELKPEKNKKQKRKK